MNAKVLVLGASGMAGHLVSIYLSERGFNVTALSRRKFLFINSIVCDVTNQSDLVKIVKEGSYSFIINCIGLLNQSAEDDKASAVYLNSFLPHLLTKIIDKKITKIIHISTDCVFSGESDFYIEYSFKDGKTFYDRTKALGEIHDSNNLTFRNSIIGPDLNKNGIGLFNWFMKQYNSINGYDLVKWTGVTTLTLAIAIERVISENLVGIYNLVNNETITKYEMLKLFNLLSNKNLLITKNNTYNTSKVLRNTRQKEFSFIVPSYQEMIEDMFKWIYNHPYLYPHYLGKVIDNEKT